MPEVPSVKTDYDTGASSTTVDSHVESVQQPDIELSRYGTGKPKRVVVRAKIIHDGKN